jgi:glycosyltransferase involved in cell wall biosynthesis
MTISRAPVTFLMPVKNGALFLRNSLSNIQQMAEPNDEILVIDDASTDETPSILRGFAGQSVNLVILNNPKPGLVNALNLGVKESQHKIIARVDVDDVYQLDRISKQIKRLETGTVAIFSDYSFFSPIATNLGQIVSGIFPSAVSASLISSQRTPHPSVMFLKEAVLEVGGYRLEDFPAEDLSLWLRLSRIGDLRSIPENLLSYRLNPIGVSNTRRTEMLWKKQNLLKDIGVNPKDFERLLLEAQIHAVTYEKFSFSTERRLLLARDLLLVGKTQRNAHRFINLALRILSKDILTGAFFSSTVDLALAKSRRNRIR